MKVFFLPFYVDLFLLGDISDIFRRLILANLGLTFQTLTCVKLYSIRQGIAAWKERNENWMVKHRASVELSLYWIKLTPNEMFDTQTMAWWDGIIDFWWVGAITLSFSQFDSYLLGKINPYIRSFWNYNPFKSFHFCSNALKAKSLFWCSNSTWV